MMEVGSEKWTVLGVWIERVRELKCMLSTCWCAWHLSIFYELTWFWKGYSKFCLISLDFSCHATM